MKIADLREAAMEWTVTIEGASSSCAEIIESGKRAA